MTVEIIHADARHLPIPDESVQCIVTSPPYWGLRKYAGNQELIWDPPIVAASDAMLCAAEGHVWVTERYYTEQTAASETAEGFSKPGPANAKRLKDGRWRETNTCARCGVWKGAYGLEPTIEMYVQHTVEVLRECWRVLRKDGVLFWNIGDSYAASGKGGGGGSFQNVDMQKKIGKENQRRAPVAGFKPKDLCLIPSRVAIAAQSDGWWVRSMIIWAKPNPMPESVTDRPTDAYEYILMLTKSERYFWDADAVREPAVAGWRGSSFTDERDATVYANLRKGSRNEFGYTSKGAHSRGTGDGGPKAQARGSYEGWADGTREVLGSRNVRNVWMFATQPYSEAHFATFPEELPRRCILAATKVGDTVLDPFAGSGTVGRVAIELRRKAILCDIAYDAEYRALAEKRTKKVQIGMF